MLNNRSVPANILLPHLTYQDVAQAIQWLSHTFGFVEHYRYGPPDAPQGAQLRLGDAWIMVNTTHPGRTSPAIAGANTQTLTVFVENVDEHYQRAKAAGAKIVEELNETPYGEYQYGVEDLDGHRWLFACHVCDVSPEKWGAQLAQA